MNCHRPVAYRASFIAASIGFGSGISEEASPRSTAGHQRFEFSRQLRHLLVVEIRARHVNQRCGLFLNRAHHVGMAMAGRANGDACAEIEEPVSVDVLDDCAAGRFGHQRIRTRVGGRNVSLVAFDNCSRLRARQFRDNFAAACRSLTCVAILCLPAYPQLRRRDRVTAGESCRTTQNPDSAGLRFAAQSAPRSLASAPARVLPLAE